ARVGLCRPARGGSFACPDEGFSAELFRGGGTGGEKERKPDEGGLRVALLAVGVGSTGGTDDRVVACHPCVGDALPSEGAAVGEVGVTGVELLPGLVVAHPDGHAPDAHRVDPAAGGAAGGVWAAAGGAADTGPAQP